MKTKVCSIDSKSHDLKTRWVWVLNHRQNLEISEFEIRHNVYKNEASREIYIWSKLTSMGSENGKDWKQSITIYKTKFGTFVSKLLIKKQSYLSIKLSGYISPKLRWLNWANGDLFELGETSAWRDMSCRHSARRDLYCRHSTWRDNIM